LHIVGAQHGAPLQKIAYVPITWLARFMHLKYTSS
jgi:hypothetical protein